eukprot:Gregarina_sp_Poly_1__10644@NODE_7_length_24424_cov_76_286365_g6_i0_p7_GENE_NODE_7_length_24424_cov_76_286365_g6_i0NODE_7_length_24424_cov_76_286365_g6_i0_p7_ORF_typecomplete_len380_score28_56SecD_SecF/PF02355_16/0_12_NODE_7_length_24424_cov_76_286365_g6_i081489287
MLAFMDAQFSRPLFDGSFESPILDSSLTSIIPAVADLLFASESSVCVSLALCVSLVLCVWSIVCVSSTARVSSIACVSLSFDAGSFLVVLETKSFILTSFRFDSIDPFSTSQDNSNSPANGTDSTPTEISSTSPGAWPPPLIPVSVREPFPSVSNNILEANRVALCEPISSSSTPVVCCGTSKFKLKGRTSGMSKSTTWTSRFLSSTPTSSFPSSVSRPPSSGITSDSGVSMYLFCVPQDNTCISAFVFRVVRISVTICPAAAVLSRVPILIASVCIFCDPSGTSYSLRSTMRCSCASMGVSSPTSFGFVATLIAPISWHDSCVSKPVSLCVSASVSSISTQISLRVIEVSKTTVCSLLWASCGFTLISCKLRRSSRAS